ncbi:hypothetical protein KW789_01040 [Candidatus Saccharibacteria bacterium]|jgi:hypothetical protein|nr:hypothetical protein [Candidatus Saccharibacteria bacterium]
MKGMSAVALVELVDLAKKLSLLVLELGKIGLLGADLLFDPHELLVEPLLL